MNEFDTPVTVCLSHARFVPCRHETEQVRCHLSSDPVHVERVRLFQLGHESVQDS